jgi:murein L,D-transpeptidase YafK
VLPFRMTALNLDRFRDKPDAPFWTSLKAGYDLFEDERVPPKVYVCGKTYTFAAAGQSRDLSGPIVEQCRTASSAGS